MGTRPWRARPEGGHDDIMWIFIMLMWRIVGRLLRRAGWGGLLVPVAAMGMALVGVHVWTVALVLVALAMVASKPLLAAALLPLSMICAGLAGLVAAAMVPGGSFNWVVQNIFVKSQGQAAPPALTEVPVSDRITAYSAG